MGGDEGGKQTKYGQPLKFLNSLHDKYVATHLNIVKYWVIVLLKHFCWFYLSKPYCKACLEV